MQLCTIFHVIYLSAVCGWGSFSETGLVPCFQCPLDSFAGSPPVDGFKECQACPQQTYTYQPGASHISECRGMPVFLII